MDWRQLVASQLHEIGKTAAPKVSDSRSYDLECLRQVVEDYPDSMADQEAAFRALTRRSRATFFRLKKMLEDGEQVDGPGGDGNRLGCMGEPPGYIRHIEQFRKGTTMELHGMPETFWVVTTPSPGAEMADICFACTFERLMRQVRGGLQEDEIVAIYADETEARKAAARLLGEYPVRPQDAMFAEVVVHVMVTPKSEDMTARELGEAAIEAVANAVHDAEQRGHYHRQEGRVSLGMSAVVELHNQLTVIGQVV